MTGSQSVVIPTYGRPAQLARLLASIVPAELSSDEPEVVVVDDGSAPHTYDEVQAAYPSVIWLRQPRSGPATARNTGWQASTGDVVVFIDDDCVLAAGALSLLQEALTVLDAAGATIEPLHSGHLVADFMHAEHLVTHKMQDGEVRWLVTACLAVRRAALEVVGGFDEQLTSAGGEDVDLSLRLKEAGFRLGVAPAAVALHDHRASLRLLVRTYYRHGTGQRRLATRHPERRTDLAGSTRARLSPAAWARTYREYRQEESVLASVAFIGLRLTMMVPWLIGAWRGPSGDAS